jgi:hypothetical protein
MPTSSRTPVVLNVLTNQLNIVFPASWEKLLDRYTIWRYQLSPSQNTYRVKVDTKNFPARFTNDYKNTFDRPFFFFQFETPTAALYTLVRYGETPKPWLYRFGKAPLVEPEAIRSEVVHPRELKPHVILKLMLALCFFETRPDREQERRVCQSKFFLSVKLGRGGNSLTAVEIIPKVSGTFSGCVMTLTAASKKFVRVTEAKSLNYADVDGFYELFHSEGQTYLRQLRPNQVATFTGAMYYLPKKKYEPAKADWYVDGGNLHPNLWRQNRSYLVRHVQERLISFLNAFDFQASYAVESMKKLQLKEVNLPIKQLQPIQVIDNRLNNTDGLTEQYLQWLNSYQFPIGKKNGKKVTTPLAFKLVETATASTAQPLLVLNDAEKAAFGYDEGTDLEAGTPRLLTSERRPDPYQLLYGLLPDCTKQSLNVNLNKVGEYTSATDYLTYPLPAQVGQIEEEQDDSKDKDTNVTVAKNLGRNLEVCISELWLKWVIAERAGDLSANGALPHFSQWQSWGFMHCDTLLYTQDGQVRFEDLSTPPRRELRERFTDWAAIRDTYRTRTHKKEKDDDTSFRDAYFVLIGQGYVEIERTDVMAMPNWPALKAIKEQNSLLGPKTREALGVYAGGIWYNAESNKYIVSGYQSSNGREARGHHVYQLHSYGPVGESDITALLGLLTVTFVRKNQYTVLPYPFDLLRLYQELTQQV